jgi:hypothetical protein
VRAPPGPRADPLLLQIARTAVRSPRARRSPPSDELTPLSVLD